MELDRFVDDAGDQLIKAIERNCEKAIVRIEVDSHKSADRVMISNLTDQEYDALSKCKDVLFFVRVYQEALGLRWKLVLFREEDLYENNIFD
jgi:hypothetical protein